MFNYYIINVIKQIFDWIKNKRAAKNPINKIDNKCFQYAVIVALNHEEIWKNPKRITKINPFLNKYKWKGINVPSEKDARKRIEKNNFRIALNVLYSKKGKIYLKSWKTSYSFQDSEEKWHDAKSEGRRRSCSIKRISVIKRNNF